ncbi:MAG: CHAP domain-containing protein [Candidatus Gastranaerophilales bacterium]|nr:CHAP domain-containing protein [Candidatus Gastranaerophilales bacterium]
MNFSNYLKAISLNGLKGNSAFGALTSKTDSGKTNDLSLFSSASLDQIKNLDLAKLLEGADLAEVIGENGTEDAEALATAIKSFIDIEDIQKLADADGNEEISEEEVMNLLQSIMGKDGNAEDFSIEDIDKVLNELGVDLENIADKAIEDALKETEEAKEKEKAEEAKEAQQAAPASNAGGASGAGAGSGAGGTGGVGNSGNAGKTNKTETEAETPEQIKAKIDEKNGEINDIEQQAEEEIKEQEEAKEKAMKQYGVSEKEYEEYQKKEQELEKNIADADKEIGEQDQKITDSQATIESNNSYISSLDEQISANENMKSGISSDDENASSRIAEIDSKTQALQNEKAQKEEENQKLQKDIEEAESKKTELEGKKADYEKQKEELLNTTLNTSEGFAKGIPSSEVEKIKNNIASYDTKIADIRAKKDSDVAAVRGEIKDLEVKLKNAEEKEKRNEFLRENSANQGQSIIDLANSFDGKTQSEMREIMQAAGYQFDTDAWCADFVSFIAGQTIGEENLPDWYKNCNRAYCPDIQNNAKQNGAFVSTSEAQPGDAILFDWDNDGEADHIGYVVSVNADGTVNTVEGNTSGNNSGSQVANKLRNPSTILGCVKLT